MSVLAFEYNASQGVLEIHADRQGMQAFVEDLQTLLTNGGHVHLMTPSWGGNELSEQQQGQDGVILNHVKVMLWE